jgi:hypothetical protein
MLNVPEPVHNYATNNADLQDPLCSWACLPFTQRETKRGDDLLLPQATGKNRGGCPGMASLGLAAVGDGGGRAGWLHGCEAHPHVLAVWTTVAHVLMAT